MRPGSTPLRSARRAGAGYALILVMVVLMILTILGVTSLTSAQMDMRIAGNMRIYKQLQYGGLAGHDHSRDLVENDPAGPSGMVDEYMAADDTATHCTDGWISTAAASSSNQPLMMDANSFQMATYSVALCAAGCSRQPPPGTQINAGNVEFHTYSMDMLSTGYLGAETSQSRLGGMLTSPPIQMECM